MNDKGYEAFCGFILSTVLVLLMIMPIYCCQVSDEEYAKIVSRIKMNKQKMQNGGKNAEL